MVKTEEEAKEIVEEDKGKLRVPPEERNTIQIHQIAVVIDIMFTETKLFTVSSP